MIAKEIRSTVLGLMGETLDLLRISALEERAVDQIKTTLKNTVNRELVRLLEILEAMKVIKKCECLEKLLAEKDPRERRRLFGVRDACGKCEGSGYTDVKKSAPKRKTEHAESKS